MAGADETTTAGVQASGNGFTDFLPVIRLARTTTVHGTGSNMCSL